MTVIHEHETHRHMHRVHSDDHQESSHGHHDHEHNDLEHGFEIADVLRVVFVALAAVAVWFHLWEPFQRVSVIGLAATLIGGYPIFKEAFENIVDRRMTMELSMTIAFVSALALIAFERDRNSCSDRLPCCESGCRGRLGTECL
jgi:cation transport ATPase